MKLQVLGIDLGKTCFHLVGMDSPGRAVIRKRCSPAQLLAFTANLQVQLIGMEACSGAHLLGRALREQGHEVRWMPAQYVKPYVQTNKSDYLDAEAIAEAVQRPRMRFVPSKTEEQLDLQALHRVRERWVINHRRIFTFSEPWFGQCLPDSTGRIDTRFPGEYSAAVCLRDLELLGGRSNSKRLIIVRGQRLTQDHVRSPCKQAFPFGKG
jgi:transposase